MHSTATPIKRHTAQRVGLRHGVVTVERGRRYRGLHQPDTTQPGQPVEGLILGDKAHAEDWPHGIAWLCTDDGTIIPVATTSLSAVADPQSQGAR
ncbi:hypothetical protein ACQPXB_35965 [Amycolatopsis sp. CA-161197]|uniref:hypothetical protein n=1 Tax=Amycolatopsis sp. CA-161197 TaxID=3239922 RepID=UPI003D8AE71A